MSDAEITDHDAGYTGAFGALYFGQEFADADPPERRVAVLAWLTLRTYADSYRQPVFLKLLLNVGRIFLGTLVGFLCIALAVQADRLAGFSALQMSCAVSGVAFFAALVSGMVFSGRSVKLKGSRQQPLRLIIGRFESLLQLGRLLAVTGLLFGLSFAVIYFNSQSLGFARLDFRQSLLIALDNFCHAAFLDVFELYGLKLTDPVQHSDVSAPVFLAFRTAIDFVILYAVYLVLRRRHLKSTLLRFPDDEQAGVKSLRDWIDRTIIDRQKWQLRYPEETTFLLMVLKYLDGDIRECRDISTEWPRLPLQTAVRNLFMGDDGVCILD